MLGPWFTAGRRAGWLYTGLALLLAFLCGTISAPTARADATGRFDAKQTTSGSVTLTASKKKRRNAAQTRKKNTETTETEQSEPAAGEPPKLALNDSDIAGRLALTAGPLRATIIQDSADRSLEVGEGAFAEIEISSSEGAREGELLVEALGGRVRSITGPKIKTSDRDGAKLARFKLAKDGSIKLLVEMDVLAGTSGSGFESQNKMRLTLRSLGKNAGIDGSLLSWNLIDCAGAYHAALAGILAQREAYLKTTIDAVRKGETELAGSWLFKPEMKKPKVEYATREVRQEVCVESRRVYDRERGKKVKQCVRSEIQTVEEKYEVPAAGEEERAVAVLANRFVANRGAASEFDRRGSLRWVSDRIIQDLRIYLKQPPNPALCTGIDMMFDYHAANARELKKGIDEIESMRVRAMTMARAKVSALLASAGHTQSGSAGIGLVSTAAAATASQPTTASDQVPTGAAATGVTSAELLGLAQNIARLVLGAERFAALEPGLGPYGLLKAIRDAWKAGAGDVLDEPTRKQALAALQMIEAAIYLDAAGERYGRVGDATFGTMSLIRKAHEANCTCAQ